MGGEIAKKLNSDITLLHIIEKPISVYEIESTKEILEEWGIDFSAIVCLKKAKSILKEIGYRAVIKNKKEEIAHEIKPGVYEILEEEIKRKLIIKVREGKLYEEILKEVKDISYDYLFIGKSRRAGLKRKIFKSRSEAIAKKVNIPVFIITKSTKIEKIGIDNNVKDFGLEFSAKINVESETKDFDYLIENYERYDIVVTEKKKIKSFEEKTEANILVV